MSVRAVERDDIRSMVLVCGRGGWRRGRVRKVVDDGAHLYVAGWLTRHASGVTCELVERESTRSSAPSGPAAEQQSAVVLAAGAVAIGELIAAHDLQSSPELAVGGCSAGKILSPTRLVLYSYQYLLLDSGIHHSHDADPLRDRRSIAQRFQLATAVCARVSCDSSLAAPHTSRIEYHVGA